MVTATKWYSARPNGECAVTTRRCNHDRETVKSGVRALRVRTLSGAVESRSTRAPRPDRRPRGPRRVSRGTWFAAPSNAAAPFRQAEASLAHISSNRDTLPARLDQDAS